MNKKITFIVLILGIASLFVEQSPYMTFLPPMILTLLDFFIVGLSLLELFVEIKKASYPWLYIRRNYLSILFLLMFLVMFSISKYLQYFSGGTPFSGISGLIVFRNFFLLVKIFSRFQKLSSFLQNMVSHPSQTLVLSFFMVIVVGALLLSMPFSSAGSISFTLIDSLFTATSAVCVTGLAVADTAVQFSFWGQLIILVLIQIGGLGIMILSFATLFLFNRSVSMENKMLISYMINEEDMTKLSSMLKSIILSTFLIEGLGAVFLFFSLPLAEKTLGIRIFYALFHSISAFCNAGFSLFSDSLESVNQPLVIITISSLIILGSLSFTVIFDLRDRLKRVFFSKESSRHLGKLKVNTRIVLTYTVVLLLLGTFLIYFFEHGQSMKDMGVASQYLHAFFQSVTLRTAGFNSISFTHLSRTTLSIMVIFMFIGGASGSTAGGVKVNTLAVLVSYIRSYWNKEKDVTVYQHQINQASVIRAFIIFFLGFILVTLGLVLLTISEEANFQSLLFETVSAFGTVGLSTGITSSLSYFGKMIIMFLMFLGRLGPLTLVAAAGAGKSKTIKFSYPEANISIG